MVLMAEPPSQNSPGPGGFVPAHLPSPAPSSGSANAASSLPHPRAHALRAGSAKEDMVRRHVDERLMHISRRFVKKYAIAEPGDDVVGYKSMAELCHDLQSVIDVLWLSGTRMSQRPRFCLYNLNADLVGIAGLEVPYYLNIANEFTTWVTSFPPSPQATFSVLRKLDHCFASLLCGQDLKSKETLPGFENGLRGGMSRTDMVRCKSLVESTRVAMVDVMSRRGVGAETEETDVETSGMESAAESSTTERPWDDDDSFDMDVARVYENTLVQLGERLRDSFSV
jgi:hypothetical protein